MFADGPKKNMLLLHSYCYTRIYFIKISRLKLAEYQKSLKNKPRTEILKEDNFGWHLSYACTLCKMVCASYQALKTLGWLQNNWHHPDTKYTDSKTEMSLIRYNLKLFQPYIDRKIRIFSLGQKNSILK